MKVGDRLPEGTVKLVTAAGVEDVSVSDYFAGAKVVLFGLPGAFTPTCHGNHLPGFIENVSALKEKGVDKIACLAVNDQHVMKAWAQATGGYGRIDFLADGNGTWVKALGTDRDMSVVGFGVRSFRFAALVEDGVVKYYGEDLKPGQVDATGADAILALL